MLNSLQRHVKTPLLQKLRNLRCQPVVIYVELGA